MGRLGFFPPDININSHKMSGTSKRQKLKPNLRTQRECQPKSTHFFFTQQLNTRKSAKEAKNIFKKPTDLRLVLFYLTVFTVYTQWKHVKRRCK